MGGTGFRYLFYTSTNDANSTSERPAIERQTGMKWQNLFKKTRTLSALMILQKYTICIRRSA